MVLFILVLASGLVSAQGSSKGVHEPGTGIEQPEVKEAGQGTGQGIQEDNGAGVQQGEGDGEKVMVQTQEKTMNQAGEQNMLRLQKGLENALGNVKNENAKQRLEQNMNKFQEKYMERMQNMEGLDIDEVDEETGAVKLKAKEQVKYLGFIKGKATKRFDIDQNGSITEKKPWYRFMYSESS